MVLVVDNLCLLKPHVCLLYPEMRILPCHLGKILRSDEVYVYPIIKKKRDIEHEVIVWQLLRGTTKDITHKKQTKKKKHSVSSFGKDCCFPVFSPFFSFFMRFWYSFRYLSFASFPFPFFFKSLWMNLTIECCIR